MAAVRSLGLKWRKKEVYFLYWRCVTVMLCGVLL